MDVWRHSQPSKVQHNCTFGNQPVCLQITRNRLTELLGMDFEVKFAITESCAWFTETGAVTQRVMKGHQIVVYGCNLNLLTIKQGYKIIHTKIAAFVINLFNNSTATTYATLH